MNFILGFTLLALIKSVTCDLVALAMILMGRKPKRLSNCAVHSELSLLICIVIWLPPVGWYRNNTLLNTYSQLLFNLFYK